jgi:predicted nucleic acid-binding protein
MRTINTLLLLLSDSRIIFSTKIYQLSTKLYYIVYKNILYYVPKYILDCAPKYIRLHTKIFQSVL